ncbi:unnamed protein product [Prunus armeniaca]
MSQKGKLPELQILNSNNLTEQFHGRVLEFLNHGCSAQFYMILFSPATKFGKREVMTTDNLLKFNPEGCLMILSKSIGFRKWIQNPEAASRSRIQNSEGEAYMLRHLTYLVTSHVAEPTISLVDVHSSITERVGGVSKGSSWPGGGDRLVREKEATA